MKKVLDEFLIQAQKGDLKTSAYPKEWDGLRMKVSFGMGAPARIPWIAFIAPEMQVSRGFYPVYLYYKNLDTLILVYGNSETEEFTETWTTEIMNTTKTIQTYFDQDVPRYGDSFVFKAYARAQHKSTKPYRNQFNEDQTEEDTPFGIPIDMLEENEE